MRRIFIIVLSLALLPAGTVAQEDPTERLADVLPAEIADRVLRQIADARARGLEGEGLARLALEGVAKGRSGEEVLEAVESLSTDMSRAREALAAAGRDPGHGEIEAATAAMRMGVDGSEVSELAQSGPSGRSLVVPMLVVGSLVDRGLPSDEALLAVRERLASGADDEQLLGHFPEVGRTLGQAMAAQRGAAAGQAAAGAHVSIAGVPVSIPSQPRGPGGS